MNDHPSMKNFRFCPACGSEPLEHRFGKAIHCPRCGYEFFFNAASAAGVILHRADGQVLFVRRAKEPSKGRLGLPGGFCDVAETLEQAAVRELHEETGIIFPASGLHFLCSHPNVYRFLDVEYCSLDSYFTAEVPDFSSARPLDECAGLVIADPRGVPETEYAFSSLRAAMRCYLMTLCVV